jgi:hypothetical protein
LRNLGPKSERLLNLVGIINLEDLSALGVVEIYLRVKTQFPEEVSLNIFYAHRGALLDIPWIDLPESIARELRKQVG